MRFVLAILVLSGCAFGQAVRFDSVSYTTSASCSSGKQCPVQALPGTLVNLCAGTVATLSGCLSAPVTTYTSATAGTPCSNTSQLTPATGGACASGSDAQGNFGFWVIPGSYSYYMRVPISAGGGTYGPYPISVGTSAGCPLGYTCDANYSTLQAAVTAAGSGPLYVTRAWSPTANIPISAANFSMTCSGSAQIRLTSGTLTQSGILLFSGANQFLINCSFTNPSNLAGRQFVQITAGATNFQHIGNTYDGASTSTGGVWWNGQATNLGIINGVSRGNTYSHFGVPASQSSVAEQINNPTHFLSEDESFDHIAGEARHAFVLGATPRTDEGASITVRGGSCTAWENFCFEMTDYNYSSYLVDNVRCADPQKDGAGCLSLTPSPALGSGTADTVNSGAGGALTWVSGDKYCTTCGWQGTSIKIAGFKYFINTVSDATHLTVYEPTGTQSGVAIVQPYNVAGTKISSGTVSNNRGVASYSGHSISDCFELDVQNAEIFGNSCIGNSYGMFSYNGGHNHIYGNHSENNYGIAIQFNPSWIAGDDDVIEGNSNINSCIGFMQAQAHSIKNNTDLRNPGACAADTTPLGGGHSPYQSILFTSGFGTTSGHTPLTALDGNKLILGVPVGSFSIASNWGTDFDWYAHSGQVSVAAHSEQIENQNSIPLGYGWVGGADLTNSVFDAESYTNLAKIGNYNANENITYHHNQAFSGNNQPVSFTGVTTNTSQTITVSNTLGLAVGQVVSGTNIPTGSLISGLTDNTSITIDQAATGSGSESLMATGPGLDFTIMGPETPITSQTCTTGAGAGSGATCRFLYSSSPFNGILEVDTAGTPSSGGTVVTMNIPNNVAQRFFVDVVTCSWGNSSGLDMDIGYTPVSNVAARWSDISVALVTGSTYRIAYTCLPTNFPFIQ